MVPDDDDDDVDDAPRIHHSYSTYSEIKMQYNVRRLKGSAND